MTGLSVHSLVVATVAQGRNRYLALLAMCDANLGRVLDLMDERVDTMEDDVKDLREYVMQKQKEMAK